MRICIVPGKRADFSVHADRVDEMKNKKAGREFHTAFYLIIEVFRLRHRYRRGECD